MKCVLPWSDPHPSSVEWMKCEACMEDLFEKMTSHVNQLWKISTEEAAISELKSRLAEINAELEKQRGQL